MTQTTKMASARARKYSFDLSRYYRTPATQVSLSLVLSIFLVTFFVLVALRPTFVTITKLKTKIETSEKTLTQLTNKAQALEQAASVWEQIQPAITYLDSGIPQNGPMYQALTKSLEVIGNEAGVEITSLLLGPGLLYSETIDAYSGSAQEVVEMEMTTRVVGSFTQSLEFLKKLLQMNRLVGLEAVTIMKESSVTSDSQVGMSITGTVQYLANPTLLNKAVGAKGAK